MACGAFYMTYIELPAFDMLSGLFARDDDDKLRNLAAIHPLLQLAHDLLDVGLDLVIGSHHHSQAIFLYTASL
jgi:hypothetical protein